MADVGFRVVLAVPACRRWPFEAQWRNTPVGKCVKQALRIARRHGLTDGLDVLFYGRDAAGTQVVAPTRLDSDQCEQWLREWTYLPEDFVSLSKEPRRGLRLAERFGAGVEKWWSAPPLPGVRAVFERAAERPELTLVLFWLNNGNGDLFNDVLTFLRRQPTPNILWQFFTKVQDDPSDRYWKRNGRHRGEDVPTVRFHSTWQPRRAAQEFRRWQQQLDGPRT